MIVRLNLIENMKISGKNSKEQETLFDTSLIGGGNESAASPMEILLQAMGACSLMDVVSILRKKRINIEDLQVEIDGTRADEHPKVFKKVHLKYYLKSPNAEINDLVRSIELSQTKYCGASAMFQRSGCEVTYEGFILTD